MITAYSSPQVMRFHKAIGKNISYCKNCKTSEFPFFKFCPVCKSYDLVTSHKKITSLKFKVLSFTNSSDSCYALAKSEGEKFSLKVFMRMVAETADIKIGANCKVVVRRSKTQIDASPLLYIPKLKLVK